MSPIELIQYRKDKVESKLIAIAYHLYMCTNLHRSNKTPNFENALYNYALLDIQKGASDCQFFVLMPIESKSKQEDQNLLQAAAVDGINDLISAIEKGLVRQVSNRFLFGSIQMLETTLHVMRKFINSDGLTKLEEAVEVAEMIVHNMNQDNNYQKFLKHRNRLTVKMN